MKRITTVRGDISPNELGFTTMHEHTIGDLAFLRNTLPFIPPIPKQMLTLTPENFAFLRNGAGLFSDECFHFGRCGLHGQGIRRPLKESVVTQ